MTMHTASRHRVITSVSCRSCGNVSLIRRRPHRVRRLLCLIRDVVTVGGTLVVLWVAIIVVLSALVGMLGPVLAWIGGLL